MDTLRLIVQSIVIIIFITALLEIVLPNSEMKGYINLIIGLFIIVAVLNPFLGLMNKEFNFDILKESSELVGEDTDSLIKKGQNLAAEQKNKLTQTYKEKLSRQIMALAGLRPDFDVTGVMVEIVEDPADPAFGRVNKIVLKTDSGTGKSGDADSGEAAVSEINLTDIKINPGQAESLPSITDSGIASRNLREMVADFYGLDLKQVEISQ